MFTFAQSTPFNASEFPTERSESIDRSFRELKEDPWYRMPGACRFRAMSKFSRIAGEWRRVLDDSFYQSAEVNAFNGGIERRFDSICLSDVPEAFLLGMAENQACAMELNTGDWEVNVHQIRVQTSALGMPEGLATPEGIHQDGHDFIGMVLWNRANVSGGVSQIHDEAHRVVKALTLMERGEGLLIDDRRFFHSVSPFYPKDPTSCATRDVFIFDWNRYRS